MDCTSEIATFAIPALVDIAYLLLELCLSVFAVYLGYEAVDSISSLKIEQVFRSSEAQNSINVNEIDWGKADETHVLRGTKGKHTDGWKRLGIDPGNNNSWGQLIPLLKEIVENADDYYERVLDNGAKLLYYSKTFYAEGVNVVVKIWVSADGLIQRLSDAIPMLIR